MPFSKEEFIRETMEKMRKDPDVIRWVLEEVPTKELLEGVPVEERLEGVPVKERLEGVPVEELLQGLSPEMRALLLQRLRSSDEAGSS